MDYPQPLPTQQPQQSHAGRLLHASSHRLRSFLDAWLCRHCPLCSMKLGHDETGLCSGCCLNLPGGMRRRCHVCAAPMKTVEAKPAETFATCDVCLRAPPAYDQSLVLADYAPPLDRLILALKFGRQLALADALGHLLSLRLAQAGPVALSAMPTVLVPVPLSPARMAERGFNQSGRIARPVSRMHRLPLQNRALVRVRETSPQSALPLQDRLSNLADAFVASPAFNGSRVIVVDDVMTSGATLQQVAQTLKNAGALQVINLVVARTP